MTPARNRSKPIAADWFAAVCNVSFFSTPLHNPARPSLDPTVMARLIKTDTPAKKRHEKMRSSAEVLRMLAQKPAFDDEAKDMCAFLVFTLRGIFKTIDESAQAWDERNYWKKAEKLRHDWRWSRIAADELEKMIMANNWSAVPEYLISLVPHFSGITVTTVTRDSGWWCGALKALRRQHDN